jgi:hypothetical protein
MAEVLVDSARERAVGPAAVCSTASMRDPSGVARNGSSAATSSGALVSRTWGPLLRPSWASFMPLTTQQRQTCDQTRSDRLRDTAPGPDAPGDTALGADAPGADAPARQLRSAADAGEPLERELEMTRPHANVTVPAHRP